MSRHGQANRWAAWLQANGPGRFQLSHKAGWDAFVNAAPRAGSSGCSRRNRPNSTRRPATWAGATSAPIATAAASVAPLACSSRGKCAAIAVLMNQVAAKTKASRRSTRR